MGVNRALAVGLALGWLAGVATSVAIQSRAEPQIRGHAIATRTKASAREDGTWWQSRFETDNKLIDRGYRLGLSYPWGRALGVDWRGQVEYVELGQFSSDNIATNDDADVGRSVLRCNAASGAQCLSRYQGTGGAYGTAFGTSAEYQRAGAAIGAELGVLFYRSWWNESVTHFQDCGWNVTSCGAIHEYNHATGDHSTPYLGAFLRYKAFYAGVRRYNNVYAQGPEKAGANKGDVGLFGKGLTEWALGLTVAF